MNDMEKEISKNYILWLSYGSEGWQPYGFDTLQEAVDADKHYCSMWKVTKSIHYKVIAEEEPTTC